MLYGVAGGRSLRTGLLLGAASAALASMSVSALAQDQGGTETVVVTGSRIPQAGLYSASPVTAIGQQELKFEGSTDVGQLISQLPADFVDQNSGESNAATGTATVDLRGLGSKRTLVLVNGTRLMPGDPTDPVADINNIPAPLVDHIDVQTGGASAVYGSDALAGVVNFVLRKDFEGIELDGTYGIYNNNNDNARWRDMVAASGFAQSPENVWNGQTENGTLLLGVNSPNGKGNITTYLGYQSASPVLEASRDYSACTAASTGPGTECSGSSNYNRWISFDAGADLFNTGGQFVPYTGANDQHFNYGALNYFQRQDTRYTGGFFGHYEENKSLDFYSSFMFMQDSTISQLAPSGLFLGGGDGPSGVTLVNCGNPYMTASENTTLCGDGGTSTVAGGFRPNGTPFTYFTGSGNITPGQSTDYIGWRNIGGENRDFTLTHASYRMQLGARGDLGDGWSYDVYGQEGYTTFQQIQQGNLSVSRIQNALEVDPLTDQCFASESLGGLPATSPSCVPLNIFGAFSGARAVPGAEQYVTIPTVETGFTEEKVVSGSLTGNLGEWGAQSPWAKDPVAVAIGSEYRQESLNLQPDAELQLKPSDVSGNGGSTIPVPTSSFNVKEGFGEVQVPVIEGMPFAEDVLLKGGYRYSSYDIAGSTNTWYGSAEWQPVDDIRFRASQQRSVRAPNVLELFAPQNVVLNSGTTDPCGPGAAGAVAANCISGGGFANAKVPANLVGSGILACPATQCNVLAGGNVHLKPETSTTRSAGIVFTPTFLDGFTATIDWWDISVANVISSLPQALVLNECYGASSTAATQSYFCQFVNRNGGHLIYGTGGYTVSTDINSGYLKTSGLDYELNYQLDTANLWGLNEGSLSFNVIGTYLNTLTQEPLPIGPGTSAIASQSVENCAGLYGSTCSDGNPSEGPNPRWRQKLRVTWSTPWDVDFSFAWRYVGAVSLDADTTNSNVGGGPGKTVCANGTVYGVGDCADAHIASYDYFDLASDWTVREGVDLRAGVNNILDTEPPVIGLSALPLPAGNGNTFTGAYDYLGRYVFVSATIKY